MEVVDVEVVVVEMVDAEVVVVEVVDVEMVDVCPLLPGISQIAIWSAPFAFFILLSADVQVSY